ARMINFIETDIGRPLTHISNNIRNNDLMADVQQVLGSGTAVEKEVLLTNGKNILMSVMPYLTHDGKKDGVIITFVDITAITDLNNIIRGVFNSSPSAIFAFQAKRDTRHIITDFTLLSANYTASALLERSNENIKGASLKREFSLLATGG